MGPCVISAISFLLKKILRSLRARLSEDVSSQEGKASTQQTTGTARKSPPPDLGPCCSVYKLGADLASLGRGQGPHSSSA